MLIQVIRPQSHSDSVHCERQGTRYRQMSESQTRYQTAHVAGGRHALLYAATNLVNLANCWACITRTRTGTLFEDLLLTCS